MRINYCDLKQAREEEENPDDSGLIDVEGFLAEEKDTPDDKNLTEGSPRAPQASMDFDEQLEELELKCWGVLPNGQTEKLFEECDKISEMGLEELNEEALKILEGVDETLDKIPQTASKIASALSGFRDVAGVFSHYLFDEINPLEVARRRREFATLQGFLEGDKMGFKRLRFETEDRNASAEGLQMKLKRDMNAAFLKDLKKVLLDSDSYYERLLALHREKAGDAKREELLAEAIELADEHVEHRGLKKEISAMVARFKGMSEFSYEVFLSAVRGIGGYEGFFGEAEEIANDSSTEANVDAFKVRNAKGIRQAARNHLRDKKFKADVDRKVKEYLASEEVEFDGYIADLKALIGYEDYFKRIESIGRRFSTFLLNPLEKEVHELIREISEEDIEQIELFQILRDFKAELQTNEATLLTPLVNQIETLLSDQPKFKDLLASLETASLYLQYGKCVELIEIIIESLENTQNSDLARRVRELVIKAKLRDKGVFYGVHQKLNNALRTDYELVKFIDEMTEKLHSRRHSGEYAVFEKLRKRLLPEREMANVVEKMAADVEAGRVDPKEGVWGEELNLITQYIGEIDSDSLSDHLLGMFESNYNSSKRAIEDFAYFHKKFQEVQVKIRERFASFTALVRDPDPIYTEDLAEHNEAKYKLFFILDQIFKGLAEDFSEERLDAVMDLLYRIDPNINSILPLEITTVPYTFISESEIRSLRLLLCSHLADVENVADSWRIEELKLLEEAALALTSTESELASVTVPLFAQIEDGTLFLKIEHGWVVGVDEEMQRFLTRQLLMIEERALVRDSRGQLVRLIETERVMGEDGHLYLERKIDTDEVNYVPELKAVEFRKENGNGGSDDVGKIDPSTDLPVIEMRESTLDGGYCTADNDYGEYLKTVTNKEELDRMVVELRNEPFEKLISVLEMKFATDLLIVREYKLDMLALITAMSERMDEMRGVEDFERIMYVLDGLTEAGFVKFAEAEIRSLKLYLIARFFQSRLAVLDQLYDEFDHSKNKIKDIIGAVDVWNFGGIRRLLSVRERYEIILASMAPFIEKLEATLKTKFEGNERAVAKMLNLLQLVEWEYTERAPEALKRTDHDAGLQDLFAGMKQDLELKRWEKKKRTLLYGVMPATSAAAVVMIIALMVKSFWLDERPEVTGNFSYDDGAVEAKADPVEDDDGVEWEKRETWEFDLEAAEEKWENGEEPYASLGGDKIGYGLLELAYPMGIEDGEEDWDGLNEKSRQILNAYSKVMVEDAVKEDENMEGEVDIHQVREEVEKSMKRLKD